MLLAWRRRDVGGVAFFAYSSETCEPCILPSGDFYGTPEEALDAAAESHWG